MSNKKYTLRIDEDLLGELAKIAEKGHISVNTQLILLVEQFIKDTRPSPDPPA